MAVSLDGEPGTALGLDVDLPAHVPRAVTSDSRVAAGDLVLAVEGTATPTLARAREVLTLGATRNVLIYRPQRQDTLLVDRAPRRRCDDPGGGDGRGRSGA